MAWVNAQMRKKAGTRQIEDLSVDMQDGVALIDLVQIVGGCTLIMQRTLAKFLRNYPIICQLFFYFVIMTTYIYEVENSKEKCHVKILFCVEYNKTVVGSNIFLIIASRKVHVECNIKQCTLNKLLLI